jgi:uncharacterized membrane protein YbhN (UPF0104 family)
LRNIDPWPALAMGMVAYLLGHLLRGFRCAFFTSRYAPLRTLPATAIVLAGYASNNVFPLRLGEILRVGLLKARTGLPFFQAMSITVVERVADGLAITLLLVMSVSFVSASPLVRTVASGGGLFLGIAALGIAGLVGWPQLFIGLAARLARVFGTRAAGLVRLKATELVAGLQGLRQPRVLFVFCALSIAVWCAEGLMFMSVMSAFREEAHFGSALLVMSITGLGIMLPSTPGFVGTFHFFCAQAAISLGWNAELAWSYAIVTHLLRFIPVTALGGLALISSGINLSQTVQAVEEWEDDRTAAGAESLGVPADDAP